MTRSKYEAMTVHTAKQAVKDANVTLMLAVWGMIFIWVGMFCGGIDGVLPALQANVVPVIGEPATFVILISVLAVAAISPLGVMIEAIDRRCWAAIELSICEKDGRY